MKNTLQRAAERIRQGEPAGLVIHTEAKAAGISTGELSKQLRDASMPRKKKQYQNIVPAWRRKYDEEN